ncbi:LOW QUALITY PROTEIN: CWF19-like protein 2 [Ipomoea triloba]|uniref:LOW QUALITY PROTEIN: CWF19-like protein 2 n=1 Tax=Ipomoea triloba TaxID=35885 RepID=UPI00125D3324|nr:LOW QUALITY PROTEIN: CWF19-like protein 2 [Ipomoea triloba]
MEAEMRVPKLKDSLSWGERKKQKISSEDTHILSSSAMSNLNKFADDGSFLFKFMHPPKTDNSGDVVCDNSSNSKPEAIFNELRPLESKKGSEYDYDNSPKRKTPKKGIGKSTNVNNFVNCILTQDERCKFCFENTTRPKHLVVAIANFTYLSLPQWQPIVPGHCCILTLHHESATRSVDDNVWEEIRNFKKCLIMMLAKQEKGVVFLETVIGLAKQRRHCLVECIPLPQDVAKQAPLYFKKAIDEAEDEWSQHNAKKLIDTSIKGLRASIPKDFPYFHVEFGLNRGFVHVIEDEKGFKSSFGLDMVRGMLKLPAKDMHSHRTHEFIATQKQAVASFARDWEPFNWTKQLD